MALLTQMLNNQSYLNQAMTKVLAVLRMTEFSDFLTNSGLEPITVIKKGFPNISTAEVSEYQAWVNTSSSLNCEVWDEDGIDTLIVVDIYLPDDKLKYIWKYADAVNQWFHQFNFKSLGLLDVNTRIYAKASGDTANHFTLSLHLNADVLVDSDKPHIEDGE